MSWLLFGSTKRKQQDEQSLPRGSIRDRRTEDDHHQRGDDRSSHDVGDEYDDGDVDYDDGDYYDDGADDGRHNSMPLTRPPPTTRVVQHQLNASSPNRTTAMPGAGPPRGQPPTMLPTTPTGGRPLDDGMSATETLIALTRRRPIDPVFRSNAEYASFPMVQQGRQQPNEQGIHHQQQDVDMPTIHVFDPSAGATAAAEASSEEEEEEEEEVENGFSIEDDDDSENDDESKDNDDMKQHVATVDDAEYNERYEQEENEQENQRDEAYAPEYHVAPSEIDASSSRELVGRDEIMDGSERNVDGTTYDAYYAGQDDIAAAIDSGGDGEVSEGAEADLDPDAFQENEEDNPSFEPPTGSYYETPVRQPTKPSRFIFLSDQKCLPRDLKRLQERTIKRRRDLLARIHDLDCVAARLTSKLAEEKMDMNLAVLDTFERTVQRPLVSSMERLTIDRDGSSGPTLLASLERQVGQLDVAMTRHIHETLSDAKREQLDSLHDGLQQGIVSEIRIENSKYDKVEGGIVRRFEQVAGGISRDFLSEGAKRRSETEILRQKIERKVTVEATERLEKKLAIITSLREQVQKERAKRQLVDQQILAEINESKVKIERAMLAAFESGL